MSKDIFPCRINRYLSLAGSGLLSRRKSEALVLAGRVSVNGKVLDQLQQKITADDEVWIDGRRITLEPQSFQYYMLNKPRGYVVSRRAQGKQKTIYELLPKDLQHLKYGGRLDKESRGLLILSNDGNLLYHLSQASYQVTKYYRLRLSHIPLQLLSNLQKGVWDAGECLKIADAKILSQEQKVIEITLYSGKKRHLRRMLQAFDTQVLDLYRYRIGSLNIEEKAMRLLEGEYKIFKPNWIGLVS